MSDSRWRDRAQRLIAKLTADLPETATYAEHRKALWGKGLPAHLGTAWGRRMWGQECRKHLARHGDPRCQAPRPGEFHFPDHVHFPFREGGNGEG